MCQVSLLTFAWSNSHPAYVHTWCIAEVIIVHTANNSGPIKNIIYHPFSHLNFVHQNFFIFYSKTCSQKAHNCITVYRLIKYSSLLIHSSLMFLVLFGYSILLLDPQAMHSGLQISETKIKKMGRLHPIFQTKRMINNLFFMGPHLCH